MYFNMIFLQTFSKQSSRAGQAVPDATAAKAALKLDGTGNRKIADGQLFARGVCRQAEPDLHA